MVEVWDARVCRFCGERTALGPICSRCAKLLAALILSHEQGWLDRWWSLSEGADTTPQANLKAVIAGNRPPPPAEWDPDAQEWKQFRLEEQSKAVQAMALADLAFAYLEMRLPLDALFTAANALQFGSDAATEVALKVLFDKRLMRRGAEESLRDRLYPS